MPVSSSAAKIDSMMASFSATASPMVSAEVSTPRLTLAMSGLTLTDPWPTTVMVSAGL